MHNLTVAYVNFIFPGEIIFMGKETEQSCQMSSFTTLGTAITPSNTNNEYRYQ